jgi:hypothetical protein
LVDLAFRTSWKEEEGENVLVGSKESEHETACASLIKLHAMKTYGEVDRLTFS